ncbi:MAG: EAL domain-containing protein [Gammaproteobacteria bacterium]|nr:EAL domain-containing protein [Gammaproteobacteria bacterium]
MSESMGISVLIITVKDDDVAAINTALRDAGHAAHCVRVQNPGDLKNAIAKHPPKLILLFAEADSPELKQIVKIRGSSGISTPILLVNNNIDEANIVTAMKNGARDVISLLNIERLQAVAGRELKTYKLENTLEKVLVSASQYKQELHSLKQLTIDAIADIQEGIIVNANPAWLALFGFPQDTDLTGYPIMDLCTKSDRPTLKSGLADCQKSKSTDSKLNIKCLRQDSSKLPLALNLENIEYDDDPAIRILVSPEQTPEELPEDLIEQAIQHDQKTGFFNRSHFLKIAGKRLERTPTGGVRVVAYIRPDKFSEALDDVGLIGTEVIITQISQILQEFTQSNDIYGRFGGTIFTVVLERGTMSDVEAWAEQLLKTINDTVFEYENRSAIITCTVGICEIDSTNTSIIKLLEDAEHACKAGRKAGGNRIQLSKSNSAAKEIGQDDTIWIPRIRKALMNNRLRLKHQPIGGLNEDINDTYDTLVRMLDKEGKTILPGEFMPVAERTGLSKNIDRWIIGASMSFCNSNKVRLVFIRLSADSILDETLPTWIQKQAEHAKVIPSKLCFEVAEDIAVKHLRPTQKLAEALHKNGFKFAVEHFGKTDASNRIFTHIPMDYMKIDGSLMQALHKNTEAQNKIKTYARQAKEKGIRTIAERVQDADTMAILWRLNISYMQGNYLQNQEIIIEGTSRSSAAKTPLRMADAI